MHNIERNSDWIPTYTGGRFWPFDPRPEDVRIEDIAHHLSSVCRWAGATRAFYSVAQHSVLVSIAIEKYLEADRLAFLLRRPKPYIVAGLLHDAAEAYLGDWVRPIKYHRDLVDRYAAIETRVQLAVADRFGLQVGMLSSGIVSHFDDVVLATEARDLMPQFSTPFKHITAVVPLAEVIEPWDPPLAEHEFLCRFHDLTEAVPHV